MKKLIITLSLLTFSLFASVTNNVNNDESTSFRKNNGGSTNESTSYTVNDSTGKEDSNSTSKTNARSFTTNNTLAVSKTASGSWTVTRNPVPIIINELQRLSGKTWISKLSLREFGVLGGTESGRVNNLKRGIASSLSVHNLGLKKGAGQRVAYSMKLLYKFGTIAEKAINESTALKIDLFNYEETIRSLVRKHYTEELKTPLRNHYMGECNYSGKEKAFACYDHSYTPYTLSLSDDSEFPILKKNGDEWWAPYKMGNQSPTITFTWAKDNREARDIILGNSETRDRVNSTRKHKSFSVSDDYNKAISSSDDTVIEFAMTDTENNSVGVSVDAKDKLDSTMSLRDFR